MASIGHLALLKGKESAPSRYDLPVLSTNLKMATREWEAARRFLAGHEEMCRICKSGKECDRFDAALKAVEESFLAFWEAKKRFYQAYRKESGTEYCGDESGLLAKFQEARDDARRFKRNTFEVAWNPLSDGPIPSCEAGAMVRAMGERELRRYEVEMRKKHPRFKALMRGHQMGAKGELHRPTEIDGILTEGQQAHFFEALRRGADVDLARRRACIGTESMSKAMSRQDFHSLVDAIMADVLLNVTDSVRKAAVGGKRIVKTYRIDPGTGIPLQETMTVSKDPANVKAASEWLDRRSGRDAKKEENGARGGFVVILPPDARRGEMTAVEREMLDMQRARAKGLPDRTEVRADVVE